MVVNSIYGGAYILDLRNDCGCGLANYVGIQTRSSWNSHLDALTVIRIKLLNKFVHTSTVALKAINTGVVSWCFNDTFI